MAFVISPMRLYHFVMSFPNQPQPPCLLPSFVSTSLQGKIFSLLERKMERDFLLLFLNHMFLFGRTGSLHCPHEYSRKRENHLSGFPFRPFRGMCQAGEYVAKAPRRCPLKVALKRLHVVRYSSALPRRMDSKDRCCTSAQVSGTVAWAQRCM